MADVLSKRNRFKVDRVATKGGNSEDDGDDSSEKGNSSEAIEMGERPGSAASNDGERASSPTALLSNTNTYMTMNDNSQRTYAATKSLRHQLTREALPRLDNYRNILSIQAGHRPTLDELHNATIHEKPQGEKTTEVVSDNLVKFGWIKGVLVRCLLNIWGVMLFLRLSWVVGQAGIGEGVIIITLACVVTTITGLSMSAISTNGNIKGGGTYYMISRSLGPDFGASIGVIFAVANAVAVAMYTIGFCESLNDLLKTFDLKIIDNGVNDVRIIGTITIILLTGIVVIGLEWETKAQIVLLGILIVAQVAFVIGSIMGPMDDSEKAKGFVGYSGERFVENFGPDYQYSEGKEHSFFTVFSVFFPAATGILAGANISGDLKDPQNAIPKGTMLAIVITSLTYVGFAIICGATMMRQATGNIEDLYNGTLTNCTEGCDWGLQNSFQVIELVSAFGPLIYAGCFAATLSSALASLVSAPKVFQALCKDKLYPYLGPFGRGYGKNNEPVNGYILTFIIALGCIIIAELNAIAPLISNFFLAAYGLVNFSTFHAELVKPVGWRPTFKYYNGWLSLIGAILCLAVMFLMNWPTALVTFGCLFALYLIIIYRKPDVNWGSSTQAQTYKAALNSIQELVHIEEHVKNYRPQILVLSGLPSARPPLIDFSYSICKHLSMMVCGHIVKNPLNQRLRTSYTQRMYHWLRDHKIKAFYSLADNTGFKEGAQALMQLSGLGKMKPNLVLMGYKRDWNVCPEDDLNAYFGVIHAAFDIYLSLAILRAPEGLDFSGLIAESYITPIPVPIAVPGEQDAIPTVSADVADGSASLKPSASTASGWSEKKTLNQSQESLHSHGSSAEQTPPGTPAMKRANDLQADSLAGSTAVVNHTGLGLKKNKKKGSRENLFTDPSGNPLPKELLNSVTLFQRKQKKGIIDVWWLYDDGGLTLLLPYILTTRPNWSSCKLRVFCLANRKEELDSEQRRMAAMLSKFRIDFSDVIVITDIVKKASESTRNYFDGLIKNFVKNEDGQDARITESEMIALRDKTNRHMRLREQLLLHSKTSNLIVMTLPMPRKGTVSAPLYMAWLELLTANMPPFLLVRGNQTSVLTFYS
ncbi:bumetanide-sensitive sodium-(potassium)-chloride cotransporter-like [Daphnia pulicaria]|uniref:bumetanide-sensitive sodium-(potassium)-chloride cotransporter-like n=1 Tax=Daphnia pulicaria TaxID=35523 RepID=UPI001EEC5C00|nr:bumetanide-sensitive sodium-(potassium)-chloride cotransporter-like [Daphnia pulicaria]